MLRYLVSSALVLFASAGASTACGGVADIGGTTPNEAGSDSTIGPGSPQPDGGVHGGTDGGTGGGADSGGTGECRVSSDCVPSNPDVCNICTAPNNHLVCVGGACVCACQVPSDAGSGGIDAGIDDASCPVPPWNFAQNSEPPWVTHECPDAGCPSGSVCVGAAIAAAEVQLGCVPVPASCGGTPTCGCMGCVCGGDPPTGGCSTGFISSSPIVCQTGTESRRAVKDDIVYVDDEEREALAHQALEIPLAHYRYKTEPPEARRRLGFIIDDQPDPSPAVQSDRKHVDEYGYTSMLLATVQEQARELERLAPARRDARAPRPDEVRKSQTILAGLAGHLLFGRPLGPLDGGSLDASLPCFLGLGSLREREHGVRRSRGHRRLAQRGRLGFDGRAWIASPGR